MFLSAPNKFDVAGLLIAPFVRDALIALLVYLCIRPLLRRAPLDDHFVNPPLIGLAIYVFILGFVTMLL